MECKACKITQLKLLGNFNWVMECKACKIKKNLVSIVEEVERGKRERERENGEREIQRKRKYGVGRREDNKSVSVSDTNNKSSH